MSCGVRCIKLTKCSAKRVGEKTRLDSIHQTSGEMHLCWNSSSFFFYTAACLLKTISVDSSGVLFVHACLPALWCQNCEMWYFRMCLCLVHVKGQWWRDDSTTTQYHHVVPPNRAAAWGRIHCQSGGLERPRKEPACYCKPLSHVCLSLIYITFMHLTDFYSKHFAVHSSITLSVCVFPGNQIHDLGIVSTMLYQPIYRNTHASLFHSPITQSCFSWTCCICLWFLMTYLEWLCVPIHAFSHYPCNVSILHL